MDRRLPESCRDGADEILAAAARAGARKEDLAALAAEMYARSRPGDDDDPGMVFEDRQVRVETTFDGAGVITGDLTPECAAVVTAVLESLSAPVGAADTRTREQRYHDALAEAMRRLVAGGLLPGRAGQPVRPGRTCRWLSCGPWMTARCCRTSGSPRWPRGGPPTAPPPRTAAAATAAPGWTARPPGRWPATRPSPRWSPATWTRQPWITWSGCASSWTGSSTAPAQPTTGPIAELTAAGPTAAAAGGQRRRQRRGGRLREDAQPPGPPSRLSLRQAIIGQAAALLSGPGGLASFLRTRQLGARLAGPGLPLDIGYATSIPPGIRNAVILRDRHCRWPGGCNQPAAACQVHHVQHLAHGGPASLPGCVLLCSFHHQVAIHRWGWTLMPNPDGTTTARNPDSSKVLHSHGPPARAG